MTSPREDASRQSEPITHDGYLKLKYFSGLNGVRSFAVIAVVWHHARAPGGIALLEHGHMGVDLFFVLSGFLISTLLIRERAASGRVALGNFWARRFLRLFPAYYGLLGLMALFYLFKPGDPDAALFFAKVPIYAAYLSNWSDPHVHNLGHTWTLATEEQFYLLWPIVEAIGRPLVAGVAWVVALITNQMMNFGLFDQSLRAAGWMGEARREIVEVTYTPILLGVGMAHLLHRPAGFRAIAPLVQWRGAAIGFAVPFIAILASGIANFDGAPRLILHLLICLFFAALLINPLSATTRFLELAPLRYLGTVSYGMYLYHMLCLYAAFLLIGQHDPAVMFAAGLAITIAVSAVSYRWFEQPFLRLGRRFRAVPIVPIPEANKAHGPGGTVER